MADITKISLNPNDYEQHKVMTNVFLFKTNPLDGKKTEILLGEKKRGWMTGSYNGFGGKVHQGESIDEAAHRELIEECSAKSKDLHKIGIFTETFDEKPEVFLEIHVYVSYDWEGLIEESEEMKPVWFRIEDIPFDKMWADDPVWYPLMFEDKKFKAHFHFSVESIHALLWSHVEEVSSLD